MGRNTALNIGYVVSMMGLILDIAGGLLLAKSVFGRKPQQVFVESTPFIMVNKFLFESGVQAATEAKFSVPLLVLGFLGQLSGDYMEERLTQLISLWIWLIAAIVIVAVFYCVCYLRKRWWRKWSSRYFYLEIYLGNTNRSGQDEANMVNTMAKFITLERQFNETDPQLLMRYRQAIQKKIHIEDIKEIGAIKLE